MAYVKKIQVTEMFIGGDFVTLNGIWIDGSNIDQFKVRLVDENAIYRVFKESKASFLFHDKRTNQVTWSEQLE